MVFLLLGLLKQAFAEGASAAANANLEGDAQADAEAWGREASDRSDDDARMVTKRILHERQSTTCSLSALCANPKELLYAFRRGVLPLHLFHPFVSDLVTFATCDRARGAERKTAVKILFELPWRWVVPLVVLRMLGLRYDHGEEEKIERLETLISGWDRYADECVRGIREENQRLLEPHAEVIVAAVLERGEERAHRSIDNFTTTLLKLSPSKLLEIIKDALIPLAEGQCGTGGWQ